jgi:hypothetical protein
VLEVLIDLSPRDDKASFSIEGVTGFAVKPFGVAVVEAIEWNTTVLMFPSKPEILFESHPVLGRIH